MNHKKVILPSIGISLMILSFFAVAMMGFIPHQGTATGFLITSSDEVLAQRAEVVVKGTVNDAKTYLTYFNVGELIFPKVYTLTDLHVTDVLLGDPELQDRVITMRTVGGTYNQVTTKFEPISKFESDDQILIYLDKPTSDFMHGIYYQVQGIQTTFDLGDDGKYREQWDKESLDIEKVKQLFEEKP